MLDYIKNKIKDGTLNLPLLLLLIYNSISLFWPVHSDREVMPTYDSIFFMSIAYNILHFGDFGWVAYHEPCFYSIVIAIFSFFSDNLLNAAILVSKTSKLFLVLATYLLGRKMYGKTVGVVSAIFVTFMPHIISISGRPESEALYSLLIISSVYLLWNTYKEPSPVKAVLAGLAFTMAYLTRSEAVFILFFLLIAIVLIELKRRTIERKLIVSLITVTAVFLVSILPYLFFLKNHYGTWTLGTKTSGIYFWLRNKTFNDPDPERTEWGLSPKGEINIISLTSKDVINYWLKDPARSIRVYLNNLKEEIPGFIPNDSGSYHFPQVYPIYFVVPLLLGLSIRVRKKADMKGDLYLVSIFLILFIYPLLTGGWWRYLVSYSPVLMILASAGLNEINGCLKEKLRLVKVADKNLLLWSFVAVVAMYHLWVISEGKPPADMAQHNYRKYLFALETKKAGEWAQKRFAPGSNYMVQWTRLPYYLNGRWTAMPAADYYGMVWYAKKNSVDYLVFETGGRGESEELARILGNTPDLELADVYESPSQRYGVVFLKLRR